MRDPLDELDVFLHTIHNLEEKVAALIHRSNLTEKEKAFYLRAYSYHSRKKKKKRS